MRSRQTGQVGSSSRFGGGGASGLLDKLLDVRFEAATFAALGGVNGSFVFCGKLLASVEMSESGDKNSTLLMKTTWQFSGSAELKSRPLFAICHSRAFLADRNFMSTMYLFVLPVRISRK